ncbi:hypothetical protein FD25_GL000106 [Levilactobacillus acidifarinae DSM 19394]|uniref:Uncharacterized protein n=1 Tax=Levilactobacillus acidifarinae DSM 19394 = JCM 15949 TaxID=1423715 RepID=A0A0R1LIF1_9LACO|nr:hypothetical protein FD25_GL000106 [Levilactobacillus acidifarinae DSM 19394]
MAGLMGNANVFNVFVRFGVETWKAIARNGIPIYSKMRCLPVGHGEAANGWLPGDA